MMGLGDVISKSDVLHAPLTTIESTSGYVTTEQAEVYTSNPLSAGTIAALTWAASLHCPGLDAMHLNPRQPVDTARWMG
jgi:hypothetical protein